MPWHALHSDLLLHIFSFLQARDIFIAGRVCKAWARASDASTLWFQRLAPWLQLDAQTLERRCKSANLRPHPGGGIWSLKDVYVLTKLRFISNIFEFDAVLQSPFNPRRHASLNIANAWRFFSSLVRTPFSWRLVSGSRLTSEHRKRRAEGSAIRSARMAIYGDRIERIAQVCFRIVLAAATLITAGSIYTLFFSRWAYLGLGSTSASLPLRIALAGVPSAVLCGLLSAFSYTSTTEFASFLLTNAAFGVICLGTMFPYLAEHLRFRLALFPLAVTGNYLFRRLWLGEPFTDHTGNVGVIIGAVLAMWRATVPFVAFFATQCGTELWCEKVVMCGYTPWAWPEEEEDY